MLPLLSVVAGLMLTLAPSPIQAYVRFPDLPDTYVNDLVKVLEDPQREQVRSELQAFHQRTNQQVLLVTIPSYRDYSNQHSSFEAFATDLFNHRGVGSRWRNDGVMMLVAPGDRKVRIELGSAYGSGWNPRMQTVIDRYMLPDFRRGQMAQGIMNGVRALLNELGTNQLTTSSSSVPSTYTSTAGGDIITGIFIIVGLIILIPSSIISAIVKFIFNSSSSYDDSYSSRSDDEGGHSSGGGASGSW
ncbi:MULTISPECIES: TPM domain-containing protein [unclassified Thermosynechococcus]|uniref:TPM domain-containing protein n=1 Tax=unclassified Thermosynechococcus TaxID=2622553 RepID=UPI00285FF855|nr:MULTISPECIES: TPM domain-containing protein [unclassified Thermosynechococcus]MDR7921724.1 TPM domain-containing protein [Thermosynechococcus sp. HY213]WNC41144.1 TPM domain-containing protein [Thermosynechococcus sp. WL17]WNC43664.1 TPM domain-containing protein [Thermosynechococcus sp. WL15]WNC46195.1 TPM domain-containing protein [Thermosynechococcus sp. GLH187]WNC48732.1 TPM domain-containing protein [Thermosynechococcus sp. GLH333]